MKLRKVTNQEYILLLLMFFVQAPIFCTRVEYVSSSLGLINLISLILLSIYSIATIINDKMSRRTAMRLLVLAAICIVSFIATKETMLCQALLLILIYRKKSNCLLVKHDLLAKLLIFVLIFISHELGLTNEDTLMRDGEIRQSLGFTHPNTLGFILVAINADIVYLVDALDKNKVFKYLPLLIIIPLLIATDSRTAIAMLFLLYIFNLLVIVQRRKTNKRGRIVIALLPVMLILASFITTMAYLNGSPIAKKIDDILNTRVSWQAYYYENKEITILGSRLNVSKKPLDNAYFRMIYNLGLIGALMVIYISIVSLYRARVYDRGLLNIMIVLLIYGISEWIAFRIPVSPYWISGLINQENGHKQ